jgi:hypothetical protein
VCPECVLTPLLSPVLQLTTASISVKGKTCPASSTARKSCHGSGFSFPVPVGVTPGPENLNQAYRGGKRGGGAHPVPARGVWSDSSYDLEHPFFCFFSRGGGLIEQGVRMTQPGVGKEHSLAVRRSQLRKKVPVMTDRGEDRRRERVRFYWCGMAPPKVPILTPHVSLESITAVGHISAGSWVNGHCCVCLLFQLWQLYRLFQSLCCLSWSVLLCPLGRGLMTFFYGYSLQL